MDLLDRLLGHDAWTTRQLLLLCQPLTDAQLDQEFDIAHRSVRRTFRHIIGNMESWSDLMNSGLKIPRADASWLPKPDFMPKVPPADQFKGRPLGHVLIKMGVVTREQVHKALVVQVEQKSKGIHNPIGQILVDLGSISEQIRDAALAVQNPLESAAGNRLPASDHSIPAFIIRLDRASTLLQRIARHIADDNAWNKRFLDILDDPPRQKTYGGAIAHLITHSMHHRAQLLFMLRRLGVQNLPEGDVLSWENQLPR